MDMHYSAPTPDWEDIQPQGRNNWQRLAAKTNGSLTPGNIISVVGLALVCLGAADMSLRHLWRGISIVVVGRLADIADGLVANRTGTKSTLGEAVDATCDKIGAFTVLVVFAVKGFAWWPAPLAIGVYNVINSSIGLLAKRRRIAIHPRRSGKLSAAGQWLALFGLAASTALHQSHWSGLSIASLAVLVIALGLGCYATALYIKTYFRWDASPDTPIKTNSRL